MEENHMELKEQVCFPVYALSRAIIGHYRPLLDNLGISYPQYLVLLLLWEKEPQTVGQLCEQLRLDSGTITPLLKRLEQNNILKRTRSTSDERVVYIELTESGNSMKQQAAEIPARMIESLGLTLEELQQLKTITTKILNKPSCSSARNCSEGAKWKH